MHTVAATTRDLNDCAAPHVATTAQGTATPSVEITTTNKHECESTHFPIVPNQAARRELSASRHDTPKQATTNAVIHSIPLASVGRCPHVLQLGTVAHLATQHKKLVLKQLMANGEADAGRKPRLLPDAAPRHCPTRNRTHATVRFVTQVRTATVPHAAAIAQRLRIQVKQTAAVQWLFDVDRAGARAWRMRHPTSALHSTTIDCRDGAQAAPDEPIRSRTSVTGFPHVALWTTGVEPADEPQVGVPHDTGVGGSGRPLCPCRFLNPGAVAGHRSQRKGRSTPQQCGYYYDRQPHVRRPPTTGHAAPGRDRAWDKPHARLLFPTTTRAWAFEGVSSAGPAVQNVQAAVPVRDCCGIVSCMRLSAGGCVTAVGIWRVLSVSHLSCA